MKYVLDDPEVRSALEERWEKRLAELKSGSSPLVPDDIFGEPMIAPLLGRIGELAPFVLPCLEGWGRTLQAWDWYAEYEREVDAGKEQIDLWNANGEKARILGDSDRTQGMFKVLRTFHRYPRISHQESVLLLAFWFGYWDMAKRLVGLFREGIGGTSICRGGSDFLALRCLTNLIKGEREAAVAEASKHIGRYVADAGTKQFFKEIWEGAAQGDEALFLSGIEKEVKKHDLMWSCKRYSDGPIKNRAKPHKTPKNENQDALYKNIAKDLIDLGWGQAYFACAMLSWWKQSHGKAIALKKASPWIHSWEAAK